jgi:hypothetical protein
MIPDLYIVLPPRLAAHARASGWVVKIGGIEVLENCPVVARCRMIEQQRIPTSAE